jgi:hypothetical protein
MSWELSLVVDAPELRLRLTGSELSLRLGGSMLLSRFSEWTVSPSALSTPSTSTSGSASSSSSSQPSSVFIRTEQQSAGLFDCL